MPPPARNPQIARNASNDSRGLFDRDDVIRGVETALPSFGRHSGADFGQRRRGKTSLLLNLHSCLASSIFFSAYFDYMDPTRKSLAQSSFELATIIAQELKLPQPAITIESPRS